VREGRAAQVKLLVGRVSQRQAGIAPCAALAAALVPAVAAILGRRGAARVAVLRAAGGAASARADVVAGVAVVVCGAQAAAGARLGGGVEDLRSVFALCLQAQARGGRHLRKPLLALRVLPLQRGSFLRNSRLGKDCGIEDNGSKCFDEIKEDEIKCDDCRREMEQTRKDGMGK
jgi:hypothetical protein